MKDINESYYYCSKNVRFPKRTILDLVYELFEKEETTILALDDIYFYLQKKLKVTNVNRANLREFLKATTAGYVMVEVVADISALYRNTDREEEPTLLTASFLQSLKSCFNVLGPVNTIALLKTDGSTIYNVCEALQDIPMTDWRKSLFTEEHHKLAEFFESLIDHYLLTIVAEEGDINEQFKAFQNIREMDEKTLDYIWDIRSAVSNIHITNEMLSLLSVLDNDAYRMLKEFNICDVNELVNLTDDNIVAMYNSPHAQTYLIAFNKLKYSELEMLKKDFFEALVITTKSGKPIAEWCKYLDIVKTRANGVTLASVGEKYGITRERVRQIEKKFSNVFKDFYYNSRKRIYNTIRAFSSSKYYISIDELNKIFCEHTDLFVYYIKRTEPCDLDYVPELNIFAFKGDLNWYEELVQISNDLPDSMTAMQVEKIVKDTQAMFADLGIVLPDVVVKAILISDYEANGLLYSRFRMSLTKKYDIVLRRYFPNGIYIYKEEDLRKFRECYAKIFDDYDRVPDSDRALYGRICAVTMLCDKGKYISVPDKIISQSLLDEICEYIDSSKKEIFITNTLFSVFEARLRAEGINNKYHLQGVLRMACANKYYITRDYVSKSKEVTSLYAEITKYVIENEIVSKDAIRQEFPGITDVVVSLASQNENIISGYSVYLAKEFIVRQSQNVETLRNCICEMVQDGEIHSSADLMAKLIATHSEIVEAFLIDSRYTLFSIMEALFEEEFSLSRPFFAAKGVEIGKQEERMRDFLEGKKEVDIDDLMGFARDNSFIIYSILNQLNAFNDEFLLKNRDAIIRIEATGLDAPIVALVEKHIDQEIKGDEVLVLRGLNYYGLPKINIPWDDWLVYSIINKWSNKYKVMTSASQFRYAVPIVYRLDEAPNDLSELLGIIKNKHGYDDVQMAIYKKEKSLEFEKLIPKTI